LFDGTAPRTGLSRKDVCLLRAALLDGPVAAMAFAAWREGIDLADIDYGWSRLLPLVQRNLARRESMIPGWIACAASAGCTGRAI
jgi:hypothetical protein